MNIYQISISIYITKNCKNNDQNKIWKKGHKPVESIFLFYFRG